MGAVVLLNLEAFPRRLDWGEVIGEALPPGRVFVLSKHQPTVRVPRHSGPVLLSSNPVATLRVLHSRLRGE